MKAMLKFILAALAIMAFAVVHSASAQEMKERTIKEQIVGTWWVISVVNERDGAKCMARPCVARRSSKTDERESCNNVLDL
ncbi:MAG: hypothetical protein DMF42_10070 [Verrucomicrobia bacterium]|nr:MAG: hypothetical protein DMF42_10070 [Verrucomicrobiota bacterium]